MAAKEAAKNAETLSTDSESNVTTINPHMQASGSRTDISVASTSNTQQATTSEQQAKEEEKKKKKAMPNPPLVKALFKVYGPYMLVAQAIMVVYVFLYYLNPCILW